MWSIWFEEYDWKEKMSPILGIDKSYEVQAVAHVSHHMPRMLQLQC